jgi:hypothetical protein
VAEEAGAVSEQWMAVRRGGCLDEHNTLPMADGDGVAKALLGKFR